MRDFIKNVEIKNFKSVHNVLLEDCSRINLFIGKPNVGKSNILEALGLFSLPYVKSNVNKRITNFLRLENEAELFFDGNIDEPIQINTDIGNCVIKYTRPEDTGRTGNRSPWANWRRLMINLFFRNYGDELQFYLDEKMNVKTASRMDFDYPVKKYSFSTDIKWKRSSIPFLIPPAGINLLHVLYLHRELKDELINMFSEYGMELVFDKASQSIKLVKKNKERDVFLIPYNSVADTLQRIIFFKSAIASNENSILLFEEPEAHSFPPYIVHITQQIIHAESNQFFISTHSPYLVNDFLENSRDELSIFMMDFQNGKTVVRRLNEQEIFDIYQYGLDLFANNESFL